MTRGDIRGDKRAPSWLQRLITSRFGRTLHGEPRYRLVWSASRFERSGGEWTDWEATVSARARQAGAVAPIRRVVEMRWTPKYPGEQAWLIERWVPASSYGTPERWYSTVAEGGTVLPCGIASCGDYPQFGDYEDIGARMTWYPTERHVMAAIGHVEQVRDRLPQSVWGRALRRTYQAQQEQEQRDREYDQLASDLFDDASPAFGGAPMIGAGGSHRPALVEMAERIGIREHPL